MKRVTALLLILLMVLTSCKLKDDEEDDNNPVNPCEITMKINSPVNGDTLRIGSSFEIKWTSNTVQRVLIDYTTDNGANWINIVGSIDNTGSYNWSPIPNSPSNLCRIRLMTVDSLYSVLSEGYFIIAN